MGLLHFKYNPQVVETSSEGRGLPAEAVLFEAQPVSFAFLAYGFCQHFMTRLNMRVS